MKNKYIILLRVKYFKHVKVMFFYGWLLRRGIKKQKFKNNGVLYNLFHLLNNKKKIKL